MKIAFLVYEGLTALDLIGAYEVLSGVPGAELIFVGKTRGCVTVDSGAFAFVAPYGIDEVTSADVLVVPGSSASTLTAAADPELVAWVQRIHETTRFTTSVCSGAVVLARAGILRGLKATTHWAAMPFLAPLGAEAQPNERVVVQGKVITAAGVSAGIDMALYLAALLSSREQAEVIQLMIEYDPRPPYDSGHMSTASTAVQKRARREMTRIAAQPREAWAMMRLAGQTLSSRARRALRFTVPSGPGGAPRS